MDDGSTDETAERALEAGAKVLRLPLNLGIGGAMQAGYLYALERGFDIAVQVDGDGQHDPRELGRSWNPCSTAARTWSSGRGPPARVPIVPPWRARWASALRRDRVASCAPADDGHDLGFRAVNRRGIHVFAGQYPHDYPEVETVVTAVREGCASPRCPGR